MSLTDTSLFPGGLDTVPELNAAGGDKLNTVGKEHDALHDKISKAVVALEQKVGINGSADTNSLDYKVGQGGGVEWRVAAPTGVAATDTANLNTATAAANTLAQSTGVKQILVLQESGVYSVRPNTDDQGPYCVRVYPNIGIRGGYIRLANNVGNYMSIFRGLNIGTDLSGLLLDGVTVDQNDTNNVITNTTLNGGVPQAFFPLSGPITPRNALRVGAGDGIVVRRCRFRDAGGINILAFHTSGTNLVVDDNDFDDIGTSPVYYDHSTIYTWNNGQTITNNRMKGVAGGLATVCAIETHGANQLIAGNRIDGYLYGFNITGWDDVENDNIIVVDNVVDNCSVGVNIWSNKFAAHTTGYGLLNTIVAHNTITINRDVWAVPHTNAGVGANVVPSGITLNSASDLPFRILNISHNTIRNLPTTAASTTNEEGIRCAGINLYCALTTIEELTVTDNTIVDSHAAGIICWVSVARMRIQRNTIVNPCHTTATTALRYKSGIVVYASETGGAGNAAFGGVTDGLISDNHIFDTRGTNRILHAGVCIYAELTLMFTRVRAKDNHLYIASGAAIPLYEFPSQSTNAVFVQDAVPSFVAPAGLAKAGSTIIDTSTGLTWKQTATPQGSTWQSMANIVSVVGGYTVDATNTDTSGVGAQALRAKSPSTSGVRLEIESTAAGGRRFAIGNNFVFGAGELAVYDYTANALRWMVNAAGVIGIGSAAPGGSATVGELELTGTGKGIILKSPDGTRYRVTVANGGTLVVAAA